MAIAPVNKFVSLAVPVAPGLQKLYEVPTGTSALLLYTQVANVGIGTTYPKVTFVQRRESRGTGNTRDVRVIKNAEIPPNDAVILIDGRLVLEKTPKIIDRIFVEGVQQGVGIISSVTYDEPSGIATVFTETNHGFSAGDPITLAGIAFTCSGSTGITTTIFPDPQQSYTVDEVYKGLAANENVLVRTQQLNDEREKTVLSRTASLEAVKNNGVLVVEGANLQVNEYGSSLFADFFFFITGFHGFHVFSGVVLNIIIFFNVILGTYERRKSYEMVEKVGLYWHFVDLVWVFVFTFFYLV